MCEFLFESDLMRPRYKRLKKSRILCLTVYVDVDLCDRVPTITGSDFELFKSIPFEAYHDLTSRVAASAAHSVEEVVEQIDGITLTSSAYAL